MKKSQKSMAVAFAMILGCLPKNSLAAPKNNSLANEDNSLASGKPGSVGRAEQRSKKMSNSTKTLLGLGIGEVTWETLGWFLPKLWTPGKKAFKMFSKKKTIPKKGIKKIKKELRETIRKFVSAKNISLPTVDEVKAFKEVMGNVYTRYANSNKELFNGFHKSGIREYNGFRVIESDERYYKYKTFKCDRCVYILTEGDDYQKLLGYLNNIPGFEHLCENAKKFGEKIVVGCGMYDYELPFFGKSQSFLKSYFCLGLESDLANDNITNFSDEDYRFFEYILRKKDADEDIDNLEERMENEDNSKTYIVK
jgi:hypothetical protein